MIYAVVLSAGLVVGLVVGRRGAVVAPSILGVSIAVESEVEVPGWYLGLWYGLIAAGGVGFGIATRRLAGRASAS